QPRQSDGSGGSDGHQSDSEKPELDELLRRMDKLGRSIEDAILPQLIERAGEQRQLEKLCREALEASRLARSETNNHFERTQKQSEQQRHIQRKQHLLS
ncbi:MAG: hypothetical protein ACKPKO_51390, partial [Candidatus Fonsibacter sp.]